MTVHSDLREYQAKGVEFLAAKGRAILADEQGLGKTVQALLALEQLNAQSVLIVCPKVAAGVWEQEANLWTGHEVRHYHGTKRHPSALKGGIVTTNYSLLKEVLPGHQYDAIIWDEPHRQMRNRKAANRFMVAKRHAHSKFMFFLTGTPISKSAGDIWPMLHLINPSKYRGYWPFVMKYADTYQDNYGWHVEGVLDERELRAALADVMLRRLKADVLTELPPKQRQFVPIEMTPKQAKLYNELKRDWVAQTEGGELLAVPSKLALLTRLRQILVHPALVGVDAASAMFEAIRETVVEEEIGKVAVYTPFAKAIPLIEDLFAYKLKYRPHVIRGGMSERAIRTEVATFETNPGPRVLIVSLASATSFTAVSTSRPFFLGYDWEPEVLEQAEDRHHRFGQTDTVFPTYFVHKGTVDEHLVDILGHKTTIQRLILTPQLLLDPAWDPDPQN